jgi:SAM-dependent methyltransferase
VTDPRRILELIARLGTSQTPGSSVAVGIPYQSIAFDEFSCIPAQKGSQVAHEYAILKSHILPGWPLASVLDIGANVGYYSFNFSRVEGVSRVDAVDADPDNRALVDELSRQSGLCVRVHDAIPTSGQWDLCVMMNVHHWIEQAIGVKATKELLHDLSRRVRAMFFQTAHKESRAHVLSSLKDSESIESYLSECGWTDIINLGSTQPGPPRFLFRAQGVVD